MQRFALINAEDRVENVIVAEEDYQHPIWETVELVEGQYCEIGCFYDRNSGVFNQLQPQSLEQARQAKLSELETHLNQILLSGFNSEALGSLHYYDSQLHDQVNLSSALELLRHAPEGATIGFVCVDQAGLKEMRPHTFAQFEIVLRDGATVNLAAREQYRTLVNQVNAARSVEELQAIVWQ